MWCCLANIITGIFFPSTISSPVPNKIWDDDLTTLSDDESGDFVFYSRESPTITLYDNACKIWDEMITQYAKEKKRKQAISMIKIYWMLSLMLSYISSIIDKKTKQTYENQFVSYVKYISSLINNEYVNRNCEKKVEDYEKVEFHSNILPLEYCQLFAEQCYECFECYSIKNVYKVPNTVTMNANWKDHLQEIASMNINGKNYLQEMT